MWYTWISPSWNPSRSSSQIEVILESVCTVIRFEMWRKTCGSVYRFPWPQAILTLTVCVCNPYDWYIDALFGHCQSPSMMATSVQAGRRTTTPSHYPERSLAPTWQSITDCEFIAFTNTYYMLFGGWRMNRFAASLINLVNFLLVLRQGHWACSQYRLT